MIMSLSEELENALTSVDVPASSAATVELARRYARLIDEPAVAGKYRIPLQHLAKAFEHYAATIRMTPTESRGFEAAEVAITTALAEHSTMSDLGPKLLATLTTLNLTLPATQTGNQPAVVEDDRPGPLDTERAEAQRLRVVR